MPKLSEEQLQAYYSRIHNNDREILNSDLCSCLFCRQTYSAREVCDWIPNEDGTLNAVCPICGMETVIGDKRQGRIEHDDLKEVNLRFFGENYMEQHPEALRKYVSRYRMGKISRKQANETLFKHYATILADRGDEEATRILAKVFHFGTEWTKKDPQLALALYTRPCLADDAMSLCDVGQLLQSGDLRTIDDERAIEFYSKAMALEDDLAALRFADCYLYGLGVPTDPKFAMSIYRRLWSDTYAEWMSSEGDLYPLFGDVCLRMGICYDQGLGVEADEYDALRNYLIAACAFRHFHIDPFYHIDASRNPEMLMEAIGRIADKNQYVPGQAVGDRRTFEYSMLDANGIMPGHQKYKVHLEGYDETSGEIQLAIFTEGKQFIVDIENLFAEFVPGHTWWVFYGNVIDFVGEDAEFNVVKLSDSGVKFFNTDDQGGNALVLEIEFREEPEEEKPEYKENLA